MLESIVWALDHFEELRALPALYGHPLKRVLEVPKAEVALSVLLPLPMTGVHLLSIDPIWTGAGSQGHAAPTPRWHPVARRPRHGGASAVGVRRWDAGPDVDELAGQGGADRAAVGLGAPMGVDAGVGADGGEGAGVSASEVPNLCPTSQEADHARS